MGVPVWGVPRREAAKKLGVIHKYGGVPRLSEKIWGGARMGGAPTPRRCYDVVPWSQRFFWVKF